MIPDSTPRHALRGELDYPDDVRVACISLLIVGALGACTSDTTTATPSSTSPSPSRPPESTAATTTSLTATIDSSATTGVVTTEPATTAAPVTDPAPTGTAYVSELYGDSANWICRPDLDDVCDEAYPIANVAPDGTVTTQPYTVADQPPIDCFYVYPTVSNDSTFNSDLSADAEVGATRVQAAPFNQVCQLYVPIYRSVTLGGLFGSIEGNFAQGWSMAYQDVLDAWRYYINNDNHGRPVVVLAHSQGSFHVVRLLHDEIDPNASQRDRIVSVMIPGTSFQVAQGSDVGGDTQHLPLCRANDQFGCVLTWQSFRDSVPPMPGSIFGRPGETTDSACTNPAAMAGGSGEPDGAFSAGSWVFATADGSLDPDITRVGLPGLVTTECKVLDGYNYLAVTVNADSSDARTDDIPGDGAPNWGLHTVDINLVQETLVDLVRSQAAAFEAG